MALDEVEIAQRLQDHKGRIGSLEHRMDNAEEVIKEIRTISEGLKVLITKSENTEKTVEKLSNDFEKLKEEPADRMKQIKSAIIAALASGIVTAVITAVVTALTLS